MNAILWIACPDKYAKLDGLEGSPYNPYEAIGYVWQAWTLAYGEASWDWYWSQGG